jgi:hypothetical protein
LTIPSPNGNLYAKIPWFLIQEIDDRITVIESNYLPVDARSASGHIVPDANSAYDLGNSSRLWRRVNAASGVFTWLNVIDVVNTSAVNVNSSGVPVQIIGTSGIVIKNDNMGNVVISLG